MAGAGAYYGALLNSPRFAVLISELALQPRRAASQPGSFSNADCEFAHHVLAYTWDFYGLLGVHTPDALRLGVRLEAIKALGEDRLDDLNDDERLLANYVRQVAAGTVTDESWWAIRSRFGSNVGAVEYTIFVALVSLTIRLFQAFDITGPSRDEIARWLDAYANGEVDLPD
jgi:hypothetical protein